MKAGKYRIVWVCGVAAVVATAGWGGWRFLRGRPDREISGSVAVVRPVPTARVRKAPLEHRRLFPGVVRANRRVKMAFSVPGLLESLHAEEGRVVREGEVVGRLDPRDYRHALEVARAKCVQARRELDRLKRLHEENVATRSEYDSVDTAYRVASAELRIHEKALEDTVLRAPFDGVVARRYVENHEHVEAMQTVLSFQDISRIEVVIQMPEGLFANGAVEDPGEVQVCFGGAEGEWFDASVQERGMESDSVTGTYDVVVGLRRSRSIRAFPGMTATVRVCVGDWKVASVRDGSATRIPVEALWRGEDGESYVWVIDSTGGKPVKRHVETRGMYSDYVEVVVGLESGEFVATAGLQALRAGAPVRPVVAGKEGLEG